MLQLPLTPGYHLPAEEREEVGAWVQQQYQAGRSIRDIQAEVGRSYGFVRRLLHSRGVQPRRKGRTS